MEQLPFSEVFEKNVKGRVRLRCGVTLEDYFNYGYEDKDVWETARNLLFLTLEIRAWLRQGDKGVA